MMNDSKNKQVEPMNLEDDFFDLDTVACATECTGLIPTPPASDEELNPIQKSTPFLSRKTGIPMDCNRKKAIAARTDA